MDDLNTGAGEGNSVSADTSTDSALLPESSDAANAVDPGTDTTGAGQGDENTEIVDSEEVAQILAEHTPEETQIPITSKLRKIIAAKDRELKGLSTRTPEYSDTDKQAIDLYKDLNSFDVEAGRPTSRPFAEKIALKGAKFAEQVGWDLYTQVIDPATKETVGHRLLQKMGLDPTRLEDLRKFSRGEVQFDGAVPKDVPAEYGKAFTSLSKLNRENILYNLANGDDDEKGAALETLKDRQYKIDGDEQKVQTERQQQEAVRQEIETRSDADELATFNTFTDSFRETPTYTTAVVSGNPQLDEGIKSVVSMAILGAAYPGTTFGDQSMKFFQSLGVNVDAAQIQELVSPVSSSIRTAIMAEKGGYTDAKTNALALKSDALDRLGGIRNRIFADTMTKLAGFAKAVSEANGNILEANGGIPILNGNAPAQNGNGKVSTLAMVEQMAAK